jgi:hypothetical protein
MSGVLRIADLGLPIALVDCRSTSRNPQPIRNRFAIRDPQSAME